MEPVSPVERGVPHAWKRLRRGYIVAIVVLVILLGAATYYASVMANRVAEIRDLQTHGDCRARVEAEFFTGVADALNAPPAPNPARAAATTEIKRAAARLHNLDKVCS